MSLCHVVASRGNICLGLWYNEKRVSFNLWPRKDVWFWKVAFQTCDDPVICAIFNDDSGLLQVWHRQDRKCSRWLDHCHLWSHMPSHLLGLNIPLATDSLLLGSHARTRSLSLKCAELRCKKSLHWQTYLLLTNQSETYNKRKRDKIIVHRGHIQHTSHLYTQILGQARAYMVFVTNFIQPYLHQFFNNSHGINGSQKPLKRPFNWCQSHLEAINIGQDIRQISR